MLQEIQTKVQYVKPSELTSGTQIKGIYTKTSKGEKFGNSNHHIQTQDKGELTVNGTGQLNKAIEQIPVGSYVELTYLGKTPIEKGARKGSMAHQWKVMADINKTVDVKKLLNQAEQECFPTIKEVIREVNADIDDSFEDAPDPF